ncbi:DUF3368 domain-containing protein [Candidatus Contendibacter odensensis]|uniref:DUF3368 domain-containing protein n=1 Tax=Candidatus Contendobacter odensis Run_B_J11 TaxID=1400861 RepID=A0A7U7GB39_9GAMM|nr:DUF3368 domain-containing protein [Candidatus Contendobacter odensis]MBK8750746.1 DUF3368 domain-containing protein [Candidatus Competibacteraceae bacterium]CDH44998.1 conserved hypothetical protein [Candidatus Contendobacter odensis Run_B_J11]
MNKRTVINAGPLVALSLLERLDLLPALFREFWIPAPVYAEVIIAGLGRPGAADLSAPQWVAHIRQGPEPDPLLVAELDPGEASVIALARTLLPCTVIIDERRGRRIAHQIYGLPVKGTAGLLAEARRRGLVGDLRPMLYQLKAAGYFLADSVIDAACEAAEDPD